MITLAMQIVWNATVARWTFEIVSKHSRFRAVGKCISFVDASSTIDDLVAQLTVIETHDLPIGRLCGKADERLRFTARIEDQLRSLVGDIQ